MPHCHAQQQLESAGEELSRQRKHQVWKANGSLLQYCTLLTTLCSQSQVCSTVHHVQTQVLHGCRVPRAKLPVQARLPLWQRFPQAYHT